MQDKSQAHKAKLAKNDKMAPFSQQVDTPLTAPYIATLKSNLEKLKKILYQWSRNSGSFIYQSKKDANIIKEYLTHHHSYYQYDQFDTSFQLIQLKGTNISLIVDQSIIFKSFDLFTNTSWPIRFHTKFVARLNDYNLTEIFYVLGFVYHLANGYIFTKKNNANTQWGYARNLPVKSIPFNIFYVIKLFRQKNMLIQIGVEKIPIIRQGVIKRYQYRNYMQFLDIVGDQEVQNKVKCDQRLRIFTENIFNDVARKDHSEEIEIDGTVFSKKICYMYNYAHNQYTGRIQYYNITLSEEPDARYMPLPIKPYYVSTSESTTMIFDDKLKRWLSKDHLNFMERKKIAQYQKQISDSLIKRFVDFQSAKTLVELLTKIPNFNVNLTEQEKDVIGENGNVLAIGRSGTGKTTCAVLRLFSIEMLFKIRVSLYQKKYQQTVKDVRCGANDIEGVMGLHCIFLTASPVLTHEIQRYYKKLTDNIKSELQKKKNKLQQQRKRKAQEQRLANQAKIASDVSFEDLNQSQIKQQKQVEILQTSKKQQTIIQKEEVVPDQLQKTQSRKSVEQLEEENEMNQQLKDIKLSDDINNQNFDDKEEDIDELKQKFEQNIKKYHSLFDLEEKDYPGFFTVKSFIMMIDGVLAKPFFIRNKNEIVNQDSQASWHNQRKGVMMIENYYKHEQQENKLNVDQIQEEINYSDEEELQHEYLRQIQLKENKQKQQITKKLQKNKNTSSLSFEVDYNYFIVHFWPRVVKRYYCSRNITPHLIWTQIYSTIKGSATSHQYPGQYLTQNAYMTATTNSFLTVEQKLDIYQTYCQYERWKIRAGGYDLMDAVNYILNYIRFRPYEGPQIHYVMIDEVQDLPHAIVYLLSKIANYGVFYSGDTAQTIAKGVGFRFGDLKSLFNSQLSDNSLHLKTPVIKHLTINFRSHNNILQLANSVVSSIEILFPKTIDRMKKQISDLHGPKPMLLSSSDQQLLFYVLCGGQQKAPEQNQNAIKKPPLQFGCDQVIIVRDQQSKQRVPVMFQHALCLTIYEAKGLQFNDVILFNFFSESPCQEKWSLLKSLEIVTQEMSKEDYQKNLSRHTVQEQKKKEVVKQPETQIKKEMVQEQQYEQVPVDEEFNKQTNTYRVKKLAQNKKSKVEKDINDYAELCSELKLLYTAITRPRKTLIIYDDQETPARSTLERIWQRLDVVEIITKQLVLQSNKKGTQSEQIKIFKKIITATTNDEWKQQGLKMYSRGYFDQAIKCFERSGHAQLCKKAKANKFADDSTKKLIQVQSQRNAIKSNFHTYKNMNNSELSKIKKKLKHTQAEAIYNFKHAGHLFQEMFMFKQAGQCYFSGKLFEKAFECFCKAFMNKQAAESLQMQNKYRQAAQYYEKEGNYLKVIQCLDLVNEWTMILQKIHAFAHKMTDYQKQALLKKYSALALQELVYQIQFENDEEEKKPENNRVQVIVERESDQQEYDSDQDPQIAAQRQFQRKMSQSISGSNPSRKQSQVQDPFIQIKDSIKQNNISVLKPETQKESVVQSGNQQVSASFSDLNESNAEVSKKQEVEASFSDLNDSLQAPKIEQIKQPGSEAKNGDISQGDIISIDSSFNDVNAKFENDLQPDLQSIKSLVDPDDIWVKNSISQIGKKLHSEYSVIDDDEENYNVNVKIIKTKGNIFVQDQIMRKIVNIVSIINSSVQQFFTQFKGYQSLITLNKKQNAQTELDDRPEIRQFQDIDPRFINIILDTLQSFKLFKLCLFVCNRYHLPSKAGRYLLSLGLKYSTNCISNNSVNPILLAPSNFRKTQIQKGILASIALHAIYQNVNADFLKIKINSKQEQNKHSLGVYFIQGLILEGLYKKVVFMVNPEQALKILQNFNDFQVYNNLYNQKILRRQGNHSDLIFLSNPPTSENEINYTRMLLKKVLFETSVVFKFESISQRYYRQFGEVQPTAHKLSQYKIPNYLPFTKLLLQKRQQLVLNLKQKISSIFDILRKGDSMQVLDVVGLLLIIVHSEEYQYSLTYEFNNDQFLQFYRCVKYIHFALKKFAGTNAIKIIQAVFFMNQCYRIQYCKTMSYLNDIYCFVHRTSTIANQLVENSKTNAGHFAYFFQQDYNLILSKSSKVSKIITKKYELALSKLFIKRKSLKKYSFSVLAEQFIAEEEEQIIRKALGIQIQQLIGTKSKQKLTNAYLAKPKKAKQLKPSYDFRHNSGKEYYSIDLNQSFSEEEEDQYINQQFKFYRPNFNTKLVYMAPHLINAFLTHSKHAKEIIEGQQFYSAGLNSYYREYIEKKGGYNLFDAVQFKKFFRVDLYAENILSIIDNLTLFAKHNFLAENLILLMVQYRSLEQPKGFSLQVTSNQLKYFQKLEFDHLKAEPKEVDVHLDTLQIKNVLNNNNECIFKYNNKYVSEMNCAQIANLICDYLQIVKDQEASQYVDFDTIVLSFALNITSNNEITDIIRKIINQYAKYWKSESLIALSDTMSVAEFNEKKKNVLQSKYRAPNQQLHRIEVSNVGDLKAAIENSEIDYQVQGKILNAKKKAVTKITKWWRAKRLQLIQKKREGNYLQLAALPQRLNHVKKVDTIRDIRFTQAIYSNRNILKEIDFLLQTEEAKQQLISFLLTNTINSSLDFHFVLMTLNKIQECRQQYFEYCSWDPEQIHQFDIQETKEEMVQMLKTIDIWKKDEKWMRDKNVNLKKKKVFEVKWMSKSYGLSGLLKKRAGLRKQEVLQKKKNLLKRLK